jgi:hypothetical protein
LKIEGLEHEGFALPYPLARHLVSEWFLHSKPNEGDNTHPHSPFKITRRRRVRPTLNYGFAGGFDLRLTRIGPTLVSGLRGCCRILKTRICYLFCLKKEP